MADKLKVTLVKSTIVCRSKHKKTVEAMGLKTLRTVELRTTPPRYDPAGAAFGKVEEA
ncbi:MAG: uL30 family ribosomal protein [Emergencia sp.]